MVDPVIDTAKSAERAKPVHAPMHQFALQDGELRVGGEKLSTLAARVGSTPFYAYDRGLLRQRAAELRAALPAGLELHYAMKANPMPAVVGFMAGLVDGIDVASAGELKVALDAGADPAEISFAGPGKRDPELWQAVASACWSTWSRRASCRCWLRRRRRWPAGARGGAREPRLRAQGLGHEDGRWAQAVRHRCRAGARGAGADRAARAGLRGLPPLRGLAEPARRVDLRGAAQVLRAGAAPGGARRRRCAS
jgi:hypothetical protein